MCEINWKREERREKSMSLADILAAKISQLPVPIPKKEKIYSTDDHSLLLLCILVHKGNKDGIFNVNNMESIRILINWLAPFPQFSTEYLPSIPMFLMTHTLFRMSNQLDICPGHLWKYIIKAMILDEKKLLDIGTET